jgi:hypothetical protein
MPWMLLVGLWVLVALFGAAMFALGAAIGHRRGLEEGRADALLSVSILREIVLPEAEPAGRRL